MYDGTWSTQSVESYIGLYVRHCVSMQMMGIDMTNVLFVNIQANRMYGAKDVSSGI